MVEHRVERYAIGRVMVQQFTTRRRVATQCAAERHIDFLKAAADTEEGPPRRDDRLDKIGHHAVAIGVEGPLAFGRIAIATARRAHHGFGMKIAYYARRPADPAVAEELGATFYPELADLLAASDMVSLHVPGGPETANMIDAEAIAAMKPGSYLINTARGGVVDHSALAKALAGGHLRGAGLDVYPAEPQVPEELLGLENVVLLPHLGSATDETRTAMGEKAMANVVAWAEGRELPDRVV